jgi:hypothetical protein
MGNPMTKVSPRAARLAETEVKAPIRDLDKTHLPRLSVPQGKLRLGACSLALKSIYSARELKKMSPARQRPSRKASMIIPGISPLGSSPYFKLDCDITSDYFVAVLGPAMDKAGQ